MVTPVFTREDTDLYSTWHTEEGGVVCLCVPNVGEIRMSLAKAEEVAETIKMHAEFGREAAKAVPSIAEGYAHRD